MLDRILHRYLKLQYPPLVILLVLLLMETGLSLAATENRCYVTAFRRPCTKIVVYRNNGRPIAISLATAPIKLHFSCFLIA